MWKLPASGGNAEKVCRFPARIHDLCWADRGRSLIVDPWGLVLAGAADTESVIVAELDFDVLRDIRRKLPSLAGRRPRTYGWEI